MLESPSGKKYIGQAVEKLCNGKNWGYIQRWKQHLREVNKNINYSPRLDNAIRKYGSESFKVSLICKCTSIEEMNEKEQYYIKEYNTLVPFGYNLTTGGGNCRQSEETKQKKSESLKGKNKGRVMEKRKRLREEDNNLPKYVRSVNGGYRISNHPSKIGKTFRSKKISMDEKLNLTLEFLENLNKECSSSTKWYSDSTES